VKISISLPPDLARFVASTANEEGRTWSAVVQDSIRAYWLARLSGELHEVQRYWSERARANGVLTEEDLERYLRPTE
jgi:predicted transcriptional regulator